MQLRLSALACVLTATGFSLPVLAQPYEEPQPPKDHRQFVEMPIQARAFMRQDMLSHLTTLNQIVGDLGRGDLSSAADAAETQLGVASMGKYRGSPYGPGRFMPTEMRNLGWSMHRAASDFAKVARQGDAKQAYAALEKVTTACVSCHLSYRTQQQQTPTK